MRVASLGWTDAHVAQGKWPAESSLGRSSSTMREVLAVRYTLEGTVEKVKGK